MVSVKAATHGKKWNLGCLILKKICNVHGRNVCVCVRERARVCVCVHACMCIDVHMNVYSIQMYKDTHMFSHLYSRNPSNLQIRHSPSLSTIGR